MLMIFLIVLGGLGALLLMLSAMQGPSPAKALKRRVEYSYHVGFANSEMTGRFSATCL